MRKVRYLRYIRGRNEWASYHEDGHWTDIDKVAAGFTEAEWLGVSSEISYRLSIHIIGEM